MSAAFDLLDKNILLPRMAKLGNPENISEYTKIFLATGRHFSSAMIIIGTWLEVNEILKTKYLKHFYNLTVWIWIALFPFKYHFFYN